MMNIRYLLLALLAFTVSPVGAENSDLWGAHGERWVPQSRLPDFSFAGYRAGKAPIPEWPVKASVKDFGATGDGDTDDTAAFEKAIESVSEGVILIPNGRYKITRMLKIVKSHLVLRGQATATSVLYFPKPLKQASDEGPPSGSWSWSGGLISIQGDNDDQYLAKVTAPAKRGDTRLKVSVTRGLTVGRRLRLWQTNKNGRLGELLYGGHAPSPHEFMKKKLIDFSFTVAAVEAGAIVMDRPLRIDVATAWDPKIYSDVPFVEDVGLENLTIEFPEGTYAGHHEEPGYNAVDFQRVENAWVRNVTVVNSDSGFLLREGTKFCTLQGIRLTAVPARARTGYGKDRGEPGSVKVSGHHGILITGFSQDNKVTDFVIDERMIHELTVEAGASGNVFSSGRGQDIAMDHHRRAPYENLFTDIDVGDGNHLWENGGDEADGPPSGVRETFWNIRALQPQSLPRWAIQANVVGLTTKDSSRIHAPGNWFEAIAPGQLDPANIYTAQVTARQQSPQSPKK